MKSVVFWTACCCVTLFSTRAFTTITGTCRDAHRTSAATRLYSSSTSTTETREGNVQMTMMKEEEEEEPLSDLDARVLKEMLGNDKLDLTEEENMKKLLERGVAPKSAPSFQKKEPNDNTDTSPYASTVLKTITDTKLWKNLQRDASNIFETVGIFVSNRIERDAKLLASVGLFAWERAVRDAARALPSGGTSSGAAAVGRAVRQAARKLGNSSSYSEMMLQQQQEEEYGTNKSPLRTVENLYEELNTPMDEIKSVTQSIRDILKGESVTASSGRGLRSIAPAGQGQNAERQRRAYRRRKESTLQQEREVLNLQRAAGTVIDTAAEMRRELQVESSKPGYRTEGARKVIAAGAAETKRILEAAKKDGWSRALFGSSTERKEDNIRKLVGSDDIETVKEEVDVQAESHAVFNSSTEGKKGNIRELVWSEDTETIKEEVDAQAVTQLLEEQSRVVERLSHVIRYPSKTWLVPEVVKSGYDEDGLREVVAAMICARNDLEVTEGDASLSAPEMLEKIKKVKSTVDSISSLAAACAGMAAAERLSSILYGQDEEAASTKTSILLTLDEMEASVAAAVEEAESLPKVEDHVRFVDSEILSDIVERTVVAEVVSDGTDRIVSTQKVVPSRGSSHGQEIDVTDYHKQMVEMTSPSGGTSSDANVRMASVEVISDDDFDSAFSGAKSVVVSDIDEEEDKKADDGLVGVILLRGLDVLLFVLEKLFTTAIPNAFKMGSTVTTRLADVARDGMGSKGWKKLENAQTGSKRY